MIPPELERGLMDGARALANGGIPCGGGHDYPVAGT